MLFDISKIHSIINSIGQFVTPNRRAIAELLKGCLPYRRITPGMRNSAVFTLNKYMIRATFFWNAMVKKDQRMSLFSI